MQIAMTGKKISKKTAVGKRRQNWMLMVYLCGIDGLALSLCGLLLSATAFFKLVEDAAQINRIGTWMMVAAFPIVMFGAHAMDKIGEIDETAKKKRRAADERIEVYEPLQWK